MDKDCPCIVFHPCFVFRLARAFSLFGFVRGPSRVVIRLWIFVAIGVHLGLLAPNATAATEFTVHSLERVASSRVDRTTWSYRFRVRILGNDLNARKVRAVVSTDSPHMLVTEPNLRFGSVIRRFPKTSADTFTVEIDRRRPFVQEDLQFKFQAAPRFLTSGGDLKPDPNEPEFGEPGYPNTYYGQVDPLGERTNLSDWKTLNRFDESSTRYANARYVNDFDLGFGRDMHCMSRSAGLFALTSCYVDNYLLQRDEQGELIPDASKLFAATVAMERQVVGGRVVTGFYVFVPSDGQPTPTRPADSDLRRSNQIELDSEGPKSVPESCLPCHKGYTEESSELPVAGNYLPWDLDVLGDWPDTGSPSRHAQQESFRRLNSFIRFDALLFSPQGLTDPRVQLIDAWYGGDALTPGATFSSDDLPPADWFTAPPSDFQLRIDEANAYNHIYAPYCRGCHVAQAPTSDVPADQEGHDWNRADVFVNQAYYHICDRTSSLIMPNAEFTYDRFHEDVIEFLRSSTTPVRLLCDNPPDQYVRHEAASVVRGRSLFDIQCRGCHKASSTDAGAPTPAAVELLACRGSRLFTDLSINDSTMRSLPLVDESNPALIERRKNQAIADLRLFLDSQPSCPPREVNF